MLKKVDDGLANFSILMDKLKAAAEARVSLQHALVSLPASSSHISNQTASANAAVLTAAMVATSAHRLHS